MSKERRQYTCEFKLEALQLWKSSGKSAAQIENDLGLTRGRLYRWKKDLKTAGDNAFPGYGRQVGAEKEIRRLRRELEIARQERDILKEAVGIFACGGDLAHPYESRTENHRFINETIQQTAVSPNPISFQISPFLPPQ